MWEGGGGEKEETTEESSVQGLKKKKKTAASQRMQTAGLYVSNISTLGFMSNSKPGH